MNTNSNHAAMWPVMLTPFTDTGKVDYTSLERIFLWFEENGANGLFAVCQSSEMFFLSLKERLSIAEFVKKHASIPVIASGHISYDIDDQADELNAIAQTGVDAVVMITNRMDFHKNSASVWIENLKYLLDKINPNIPLGLYECPYPYNRLLSEEEIRYAADSGRFSFLKDTCCDIKNIENRLRIVKGTSLQLFNANTSTLLPSLQKGAAGFSGVMANFHPRLYAALLQCWEDEPELAEQIQAHLSVCSFIERQYYPVNAKYHLQQKGIFSSAFTRTADPANLTPLLQQEVRYMDELCERFLKSLK